MQLKMSRSDSAQSGRVVAASSFDTTTLVRDAATGQEMMTLPSDHGWSIATDRSPDGEYIIITGGFSVPIIHRVWRFADDLKQYASECCITRELTSQERKQFCPSPPSPMTLYPRSKETAHLSRLAAKVGGPDFF